MFDKIREIFASYSDETNIDIRVIPDGNINKTFLITTPKGKYILQNINTTVFKSPTDLMENIYKVTSYIKKHTGEGLTIIPTQDNKLYIEKDNEYYRMYNYIDNSVCFNKAETVGIFYFVGRAFGKFAYLLDGFDDSLVETIPYFHNTEKRFLNFLKAVDKANLEVTGECEKEISFLMKRHKIYSMVTSELGKSIPYRVTHNDTKINNVMLDKDTHHDLCVIDLDTVMTGSLLYDFGDAIRSGASTTYEDDKDLRRVDIDLRKYESFLEGYLGEIATIITPKELELLPYAPKLLTLELALRFLTDYLEGNWYFKTDYEKHNLVRAKNQIMLAYQMESKEEEMIRTAQKVYKKAMKTK